MPRYGHFKFRGIEAFQNKVYSWFTRGLHAWIRRVNCVQIICKRRKIKLCKLCVNFIFLIGVNFGQTLCKLTHLGVRPRGYLRI